MAISFIGQGTVPFGVGTGAGVSIPDPDLPGSRQNGDLMVMYIATKPDSANITTPFDWARPSNGNATGGTGSVGLDTGPMDLNVFCRMVDGNETAPTISITSSPSCSWAQIFLFRSSYGLNQVWQFSAASGSDNATGSSWSVTYGQNPDIQAGDLLIVGSAIPTDASAPNQFVSTISVTATGTTIADGTKRSEPSTTNNNQAGGFIFTSDVTTGLSTAAPVVTTTAATPTTNIAGPSVLLRLRETPPLRAGTNLLVNRQSINRASFW